MCLCASIFSACVAVCHGGCARLFVSDVGLGVRMFMLKNQLICLCRLDIEVRRHGKGPDAAVCNKQLKDTFAPMPKDTNDPMPVKYEGLTRI